MPDHSPTPVRGADRTRPLVEDPPETLVPDLARGITLLDVDGGRGVPVVQSLVLDHLLSAPGPAVWVDADGYATTTSLARLAPSQRLLDRIHVARGFTAYQHYAAVRDLSDAVPDSRPPSLVVCPALDARYRAADALTDDQAATLQARALARLAAAADEWDCPVLLTRTREDAFSEPLTTAADHRLRCEQTEMGPRFVGDEFETRRYPVDHGSYQTTFAYWRRLLAARTERAGTHSAPAAPEPTDADGIGTGVTADGTTDGMRVAPLRDALAGVGGW